MNGRDTHLRLRRSVRVSTTGRPARIVPRSKRPAQTVGTRSTSASMRPHAGPCKASAPACDQTNRFQSGASIGSVAISRPGLAASASVARVGRSGLMRPAVTTSPDPVRTCPPACARRSCRAPCSPKGLDRDEERSNQPQQLDEGARDEPLDAHRHHRAQDGGRQPKRKRRQRCRASKGLPAAPSELPRNHRNARSAAKPASAQTRKYKLWTVRSHTRVNSGPA